MNISRIVYSFDLWRCFLLASAVLLQFGCGSSAPNPAISSKKAAPLEAKLGTQLAVSSEVIVALTPRSAAELRKYLEQADTSATIFIAVSVENNCRGFRYELELRESLEGENVILTSCEGIPLAIDRDDAAFLKGTTLDYVDDPKGLQFNASHVDTMLLAEYRAKRDEEARMRPIEEAKAKLIKPEQAVIDLLTPKRQKAFEDLELWWKFHQPEAWSSYRSTVGRVDRYQEASGKWITVVFTGEQEKQKGGVYLVNDNGYQTRIYGGNNSIDEEDEFVDVNGDGLPEIVTEIPTGAHDENDPNRIVTDGTEFCILPITSKQAPLLEVHYDVRPFKNKATWRARLAVGLAGNRDVILEQQVVDQWSERARFVWSSKESKYEGPSGSKEQGFIASFGEMDSNRREEFMKRPRR